MKPLDSKWCASLDLEAVTASRRSLPTLNSKVAHLLRDMMREDLELDDLSRRLEQFPSIAARLIYLANSAWSSPIHPVTSVRDACRRLGFKLVKTVSLGLAVTAPLDPTRCPGLDVQRYWMSALMMADTAETLHPFARSSRGLDLPTLRTAGLLSNLGLMCMADLLPAQTDQAFGLIQAEPSRSLVDAQRACSGTDYCQVGACFAETWGLPSPLPECMAHHREPEYRGPHLDYVGLIATADGLVSEALCEEGSVAGIVWSSVIDVDPVERERLLSRVRADADRVHELSKALA